VDGPVTPERSTSLEAVPRRKFPFWYHDAVKRVLAGVALLAVIAAGVYGYTVTRRDRTYRDLLVQGDAALAQDNTVAAIELFSGAIPWKNDAMIGYLKRGEAYRRRGDLDAALRDLQHATALDPSAPRAIEELGDVYLALKRYSAAADQYRAYVRLDDREPRLLYKLAFAQYTDSHVPEAIDALQKAVAQDDRFAEAYYLLGVCLHDLRRLEQARTALERAVAIQPAMLNAREELADLYRQLGRTDDSLDQLQALSALDPDASREVTLGLAYARAGQQQRAILTLGRAVERYPATRNTYVALGRVWLENAQSSGDRVALSKALGALEQAVGSDDSSEAMTLFGRALLMTSNDDSAERMLQDATMKEPADPMAFYYLAEASERLEHFEVARRALIDYQALHGDEPDLRRRVALSVRLGDLSIKLNDPPTAVRYFRSAVGESTDASVLTRLADALWRNGEKEAARAALTRVLEKDPTDAQALALQRRFR
jgi:tetratricopeptide (TPR) repeat protein